MGIRYLWIDSLCILQDDSEDWKHESSQMATVYSKSSVTIAASNAKNNSVGCFAARNSRKHVHIDFTSKSGTSGLLQAFRLPVENMVHSRRYKEMNDESLSARAWVLQERILSHRILHFCSDQMYFECNHTFVSEDGLVEQGRYNSIYPGPVEAKSDESDNKQAIRMLWYNLLRNYSGRLLTKASDRLPAMSGLAQIFKDLLQDEYVAGLWSKSMVEELAWQPDGPRPEYVPHEQSSSVAPSWSCKSIRSFKSIVSMSS
jgi:hypothetical protein